MKKYELSDPEIMGRVVDRLKELNYLNDIEFADHFVKDRINFRPRGKFLIQKELKQKGVDITAIETAFGNSDFDEEDMAIIALEKKLKSWEKYPTEKVRSKAFSFLSGKGFSSDAIYKAMKRCYIQLNE